MSKEDELAELRPLVLRIVVFLGVPDFEQQDLVQEIFAKALNTVDQFEARNGADLSSWLFTVARNVVFDRWRRLLRAKFSPPRDAELIPFERCELSTDPWPDVENDIFLEQILPTLREDWQRAIRMHIFDDIPLTQLAEIEGLAPAGMRTRYKRGVKKLHRRFGNE